MQPHKRSLFNLFDGKRRYVVPLFQRQYVWNQSGQWSPLWEDIQRKFQEKLSDGDGPPHFLGAMVIEQKKTSGSEVPAHLVIDGQQRLTTFQIFLAAFRDVCQELGESDFALECQTHLENVGVMANPSEEKYKVWPTNLDRSQFQDVIDSRSKIALEKKHPLVREKYARKANPRPLMVECYLYFHGCLFEILTDGSFDFSTHVKVQRLFDALRNSLQIVVIELENNDDPQVIFETLNARGEPLLPSDLLRNYIFLRASQNGESQEALYENFWVSFDDNFWRKEEKQGRLNRPRSDIFLQHYLALKRREEVNIGHLFAEYKYWISTKTPFSSVYEELSEMDRHRDYFRKLVQPDRDSKLGEFAIMLQIFEVSTIYPLVLSILSRELPAEEENGILEDLESFIVRRAVCGLTTKNYNRFFLSLISRMPEYLDRIEFANLLLAQMSDTNIWPRNGAFEEAWVEGPIYSLLPTARTGWLLKRVEFALKGSDYVNENDNLSMDLILPDDWIGNWPLSSGNKGVRWYERFNVGVNKEDLEASNMRDKLKFAIGNIVLLRSPLSSGETILSYENKIQSIERSNDLIINRYLDGIRSWDELAICARGRWMYEVAMELWPHPLD